MNSKKKIYPWKPIEDLAESFHIYSISDDYNGFRVTLNEDSNNSRRVLINFYTRAYRVTDKIIGINLLKGYNIKPFKNGESHPCSLFILTNSEYLTWASYQSDTLSEALRLVHYCIWTDDKILEILSWGSPKAEFIDIK